MKDNKKLLKDLTEEEWNFKIRQAFNKFIADKCSEYTLALINEMNNPTAEQLINNLNNKK